MRSLVEVEEVHQSSHQTWIVLVLVAVLGIGSGIVSASARPTVLDPAASLQADETSLLAQVDGEMAALTYSP